MARRTGGARWTALRRTILDRDGWRCVLCGRAGRLEVDHVISLRNGGAEFEADNCQSLCRGCHVGKTARDAGIIPLPADWTRLVLEVQRE